MIQGEIYAFLLLKIASVICVMHPDNNQLELLSFNYRQCAGENVTNFMAESRYFVTNDVRRLLCLCDARTLHTL
jgi:hypothetical protein